MSHLRHTNWVSMILWFLRYTLFIVFLPFYKKIQTKPTSVYVAFIAASVFEMFGIPLSMYFVEWVFKYSLPVGIFWGITLKDYIGVIAMHIGNAFTVIGAALIIFGWSAVFTRFWRKEKGERRLVTDGIYAYIRHPQYLGFILITLGLLIYWATIPLLIMWPILVFQYYKLAQREEIELEEEFGEEYIMYRKKVSMFIPFLRRSS